ncbi:hypothetical protein GY21_20755 [Cryobacterium roopkundense]|uniref:DUF4149 domain-containing protein n=1 Tax=Cryobacterium roopkundense TaxID=1001240 RepID=A0A099J096_9MICO|nr:hypothetical protein [Cryobacterium roopkundense]KGJ71646.1 hypothetical protein GY21_20755 [Cryobacterium roopkundense]MBB5640593.1 hypothetical protein [Cryobacterium roopkundense]
MSSRNTLVRSLHDIGLAAWFGGSLMGAVGLNGAAAAANNPRERVALASVGWKRWAPVQLAALAAHGIGGAGLIAANKARLAGQPGARANTGVKLVLTLVSIGSSMYSGILGTRMAEHTNERSAGVTEPSSDTSAELASAQTQQRVLQWITPAVTFVLVILAAQQGEQQRPRAGWLKSLTNH